MRQRIAGRARGNVHPGLAHSASRCAALRGTERRQGDGLITIWGWGKERRFYADDTEGWTCGTGALRCSTCGPPLRYCPCRASGGVEIHACTGLLNDTRAPTLKRLEGFGFSVHSTLAVRAGPSSNGGRDHKSSGRQRPTHPLRATPCSLERCVISAQMHRVSASFRPSRRAALTPPPDCGPVSAFPYQEFEEPTDRLSLDYFPISRI